jgi:TPR repeat protein
MSLIESALAGNAQAQNQRGDHYRRGNAVEQDHSEALRWHQHAADAGDAFGQNNVGTMHLEGMGIARDPVEAVKWYRLAAEQGLAIAQYNLGVGYRQGAGVRLNLSEAAKSIELAANGGYCDARNDYRVMLRYGNGVPKDIVETARWFIEAARQHDVVALANLYHVEQELHAVARTGNRTQQYLAIIANLQKHLDSDTPKAPDCIENAIALGPAGGRAREIPQEMLDELNAEMLESMPHQFGKVGNWSDRQSHQGKHQQIANPPIRALLTPCLLLIFWLLHGVAN